jgi:hypothetical protein
MTKTKEKPEENQQANRKVTTDVLTVPDVLKAIREQPAKDALAVVDKYISIAGSNALPGILAERDSLQMVVKNVKE